MTPEQQLFFGTDIAECLNLKEKHGVYKTAWGTKTAKGIGAMFESLYIAHMADNKETHINPEMFE